MIRHIHRRDTTSVKTRASRRPEAGPVVAGAVAAARVALGLCAYAYVGYPALLALAARSRRPERYQDHAPAVSVVVSALNERAGIAARLENLRALDYPGDHEVLVVTDGSTDGTELVAKEHAWAGVTVLHEAPRRGKAAAMARAVSHARFDVIVFSDANNRYPPDALREVVRPLSDPRVGVVTGAKVVEGGDESLTGGERAYWAYESFIKRQESRLGCCTAVVGELLAVRRELVPSFPADIVNDDFFVAMQAARRGYRVAYAPRAQSWEPTAPSLSDDVTRRRRMSAGRWQTLFRWRTVLPLRRPVVMWQVLSHKYLRLLLPFAMGTGFVASGVVAVSGRRQRGALAGLFVSQVGVYGLAALGDRVPRSAGPVRALALAARYLVRTNLASAEGLVAYLRARSSLHLWERVSR